METYTEARRLVANPKYSSDRMKALAGLRTEISKGSIDEPTMDVVEQFARMPCCFTLQSCFGHFMIEPSTDDRNTRSVADLSASTAKLHYRIAYVAFCIQDSSRGRALLEELKAIADIDPGYIQFGSADWFWNLCVNSYVLQVSPLKNAYQDSFEVGIDEAMRIEQTRDRFFDVLRIVLSKNEDR